MVGGSTPHPSRKGGECTICEKMNQCQSELYSDKTWSLPHVRTFGEGPKDLLWIPELGDKTGQISGGPNFFRFGG